MSTLHPLPPLCLLTYSDLPPTLLPLPSNPQSSTDPSAANAPPPVGAAAGRSVPSSTPRAGSPPQKGTATTAAASAADGLQAGRQQLHEGVGSSPFAGAVAAAIASGAAPGVASPSAPWIGLAQEVLHQGQSVCMQHGCSTSSWAGPRRGATHALQKQVGSDKQAYDANACRANKKGGQDHRTMRTSSRHYLQLGSSVA
eukprot:1158066-Pelagomonas_calceolata.AAC.11